MSDWYSVYEETPTATLRWLVPVGHYDKRILQQKFIVRDGVGNDAKITEEWREVPFVVSEI